MKSLLLIFFICISSAFYANAQNTSFTIPRAATVNAGKVQEDWNAVLQENDEAGDEFQHHDQLDELKQQLEMRMHPSGKGASGVRDVIDTPYVWEGIQAQNYNGSVPNDNDLAVSNSGYLISAMNTNLFRYKLSNDSSLGLITLQSLSMPLQNFQSKYDPKIIYDPDENKFVVVFLAGYSSEFTSIIVAFSQTDNPNGTWNLYELPGNPLNDSLWTDYPAIALTNHEIFITVNHLVDNETWQLGWRRTVIWQVNKFNGYNGDSLHTQLHYDINYGGKGIRNLCPVRGGSHLYGADMYFVSERNLDVQNDTIFLVHITDTINAPSQQLTVQALVSDASYFVPVDAKQPWVNNLATNDSRVLGAFYENDRIQFVGNTTDTLTGNSAIYHGVITDVAAAPSVTLHTITDDSLSFGYPNISYAGNGVNDNTSIIGLLRSSSTVYPGFASVVSDGNGSYSLLKNLKNGDSYHSAIAGLQRWGDYSGAQRDYMTPGLAWVNGSYAQVNHKMSTWVSQIGVLPPPSNVPLVHADHPAVNLYPNPTLQNVTVAFDATAYSVCSFDLYDVNGKLLVHLMDEKVSPGNNQFSFSSSPLAAGEYVLKISSAEKVIAVKKLVKQ